MNDLTLESARAIHRRRFIQLSAGSLAAVAAGCNQRDAGTRRGSTIIIAMPDGERRMNAVDEDYSKSLVFLPLMDENDSGELEGRLAERWEHSPDYRDWTIHLRKNIHWHDGVPVTANDLKFTLELLAHPDVGEIGPHDAEAIAVVDDSTVTVRLNVNVIHGLPGYYVVLPKHLLEHLEPKKYAEWDFWTRPVGNGPYRFVRRVPRTMMEFEANPDYYRGKRRVERVVLKFTQDAGLAELLAGNVDILVRANPAQSSLDPSYRAYYGMIGEQIYGAIFWQHARPLLRDPRVRRALTLAINRREMLQLLYLPASLPILDGPFTRRQWRRGELPEPLPFDPTEARALLDAAGWRQSESGAREREGRPCHFTLVAKNDPGFSVIAVYVQEAMRRVGVSVDIQVLDGSVVGERIRTGKFDAVLSSIVFGPVMWQRWFGTKSPLGYRNPDVVRLLERLPSARNLAEDADIRRQLTLIFRADVPATFLFPNMKTVFARNRVHGLSSPWKADPIHFIDELWLDDRSDR